MVTLQVVGGGRMGSALVGGLLVAGRDAATLAVAEIDPDRQEQVRRSWPALQVVSAPVAAEGTLLAVKPTAAEAACRAVAAAGTRRLLSVVAGVTLRSLQSWVGSEVAVVRAMPNTPALVGAGVSAIAGGELAGAADLAWAEELLRAVGEVVRVPEPSLDAVTGLSGSGPAYVFLLAEALVEAGVLAGLPRDVSRTLALHTIAGSGRLLLESGSEPEALRAQVTSPGGTTAAGLRVLEQRAVRAAVLDAVTAAAERSRQLGDPEI